MNMNFNKEKLTESEAENNKIKGLYKFVYFITIAGVLTLISYIRIKN
jgi:hypothetical protein